MSADQSWRELGPLLKKTGWVQFFFSNFSDVVQGYIFISRSINFQVEILKHIDLNNGRMETRLEAFEKKTKAAMFNFNQVLVHFTHNVHDNGHSLCVDVNVLAMFSVSMLMFNCSRLPRCRI